MNYRFHRAALAEHLDEVAFYESRLPGLGADYLAEFDAVMARICATPDFYPRIDGSDLRKGGLKRFPFHVIYRAEPVQIVILAIAHQRRRPAYWVGRIGK
ncbi:MAG: type II toxin-antitoxin system RelE/ParE family toxin [Gammaproteobacteria bacterium]|nr:type II toxin-antitoxin system RelE/ParE family toxin [Gammaproteobacteria bacterium]